jgi:hypothetical protein
MLIPDVMRTYAAVLFAVIFLCCGLGTEARAENVDWSDYIERQPAKVSRVETKKPVAKKKIASRAGKKQSAKKRARGKRVDRRR